MRIQIVDAFSTRPFGGNPAGVVVLSAFPGTAWMQRVAAEVNLSETAFLHPLPPGAGADFALRWFTPAVEVALCGHATLATAHVLGRDKTSFANLSRGLTPTAGGHRGGTRAHPQPPPP